MGTGEDPADAAAAERAGLNRLQEMEASGVEVRLLVGPFTGWVLVDALRRMATSDDFSAGQARDIRALADTLFEAVAQGTARDIHLRMVPPN